VSHQFTLSRFILGRLGSRIFVTAAEQRRNKELFQVESGAAVITYISQYFCFGEKISTSLNHVFDEVICRGRE